MTEPTENMTGEVDRMPPVAIVIMPTPCQCGSIGLLRHIGPVLDTDMTDSKVNYRCGRVHALRWRIVKGALTIVTQRDIVACPRKKNVDRPTIPALPR